VDSGQIWPFHGVDGYGLPEALRYAVRYNHQKPYRVFAPIASSGATPVASWFWDKYNVLDCVIYQPKGSQLFWPIDNTVEGMREVLNSVRRFPAQTVFAYGPTSAVHELLGAPLATVLYHCGGILLTNKHVADEALQAEIYLACGRVDGKSVNEEPPYLWPPHASHAWTSSAQAQIWPGFWTALLEKWFTARIDDLEGTVSRKPLTEAQWMKEFGNSTPLQTAVHTEFEHIQKDAAPGGFNEELLESVANTPSWNGCCLRELED
jgi:hypothetical protein